MQSNLPASASATHLPSTRECARTPTRSGRRLLRLFCLVLCLWVTVPAAQGKENLENRADVQQALKACEAGSYIRARQLAEAILKKEPDNYCACYVLGSVYLWAEGSLPRAYHYLGKARALIRRDWGEPVDNAGPWRTHAKILWEVAMACGQMERYAEELSLLEARDRLYDPKLPQNRGWPLMKMGRLEEARKAMLEVLHNSREEDARKSALAVLATVEGKLNHPARRLEYHRQLASEIKTNGWTVECTLLRNLADAEIANGDDARGEELLLEACKYEDPDSYTNPWGDLAFLYLGQGRFPELVSAVRRMQLWAANSSPVVVTQTWAECQYTTASALLALGYDDLAEPLLRRILYRPDRNMAFSSEAYLQEAGTLMTYRSCLIRRQERLREEMSWCTWGRWFEDAARLIACGQELDLVTERCAATVIRNDGLGPAVRTHQSRSVFSSWEIPDVNGLFGAGVVAAQVKSILADTSSPSYQLEKPFLLAVLAESRYLSGPGTQALEALQEALRVLPAPKRLLRARLEAELASVLWQQGNLQAALGHYGTAFELDAGAFRALRMRLPARITGQGGALADRAAASLRRSPRFFSHRQGFAIQVSQGTAGLSAVVSDQRGTQIASLSSPARNTPEETVQAFCARFHEYVFSARLDLSQTDINDLNGSTAAGKGNREELLKKLDLGAP